MNIERINNIITQNEKFDVFYDERPVWIQEINENNQMAKIGFIDDFQEKDVFIKDLYERNL